MSALSEHLEALRRNSAELKDAIESGDLTAIAQLVDARSPSLEFLLERRDQLDAGDRDALQSALQAHDSSVHQLRGVRERISDEIATIRHGRSVARANRGDATRPLRFISERC